MDTVNGFTSLPGKDLVVNVTAGAAAPILVMGPSCGHVYPVASPTTGSYVAGPLVCYLAQGHAGPHCYAYDSPYVGWVGVDVNALP